MKLKFFHILFFLFVGAALTGCAGMPMDYASVGVGVNTGGRHCGDGFNFRFEGATAPQPIFCPPPMFYVPEPIFCPPPVYCEPVYPRCNDRAQWEANARANWAQAEANRRANQAQWEANARANWAQAEANARANRAQCEANNRAAWAQAEANERARRAQAEANRRRR